MEFSRAAVLFYIRVRNFLVKRIDVGYVRPKNSQIRCEFAFPGNEIPEWWPSDDESRVGIWSASVKLHPGWFTDPKWLGFALCVVVASSDHGIFRGFLRLN
ncbi:hypothetical protein L3X38_008542 [Prunus dulcis]|uniref:C-JID domain-containing protein n=1 Tax=Prunus dulcis TaxID=3755 RepID=A0AAD4ZWR8_PRUDU|nr:hypothetical protein L3X38_008542 [Prunus dulcis]